jgi:hypothetical protein
MRGQSQPEAGNSQQLVLFVLAFGRQREVAVDEEHSVGDNLLADAVLNRYTTEPIDEGIPHFRVQLGVRRHWVDCW